MEKEFVPYEPSSELKELGFDEPCFGAFIGKEFKIFEFSNDIKGYVADNNLIIARPTFSQAFRWFREKHSLRFSIIDDHSENEKPYSFTSEHEYYYDTGSGNNWFKTYEEAESACLDKLIEIVKNKQDE